MAARVLLCEVQTLVVFLLVLLLGSVPEVWGKCEPPSGTGNSIADLKGSIFCNYDKLIRPVINSNENITVDIKLHLKYLSVDSYSNHLVVHSWVVVSWKDEHLIWDPKAYRNTSYLLIPSSEIWLPDLSIYNSDLTQVMLFSNTLCVLYSTGRINCSPDLATPVYCDSDLRKWPFDTQNCSLYIGSWMHTGDEIDINITDKGYSKYLFTESNEWELLNVNGARHAQVFSNVTYPYIIYNFVMKRHAALFVATAVMPAFVLAGLTLLSFWMSGTERMAACCVATLGNALFIQYVGMHLPSDGDTSPDIVAFFRDSMLLSLIALVVGVGVRWAASSVTGAPLWLATGGDWLRAHRAGQLLLGDDQDQESGADEEVPVPQQQNIQQQQQQTQPKWRFFATLLDRVSFLIFLITYCVLLVALVP